MIEKIKEWLCHLLCGDRIFNADMSRELDHLTMENERLRARTDEP